MAKPELLVPARYYARLPQVLARQGIDFAAALRAQRISPRQLEAPDATLRFSQVDRLVQRLAAAGARQDLAFDIGGMLSAASHSFVGFGMLNSATLDEALRFEARYFSLVMPSFRMRYNAGADHAELLFTPVAAMSHLCLAFHLEAIGVAALRELADLCGGQRPPCRLDLSIPEPEHARRYARELRDVRVRFAADLAPSVRLRLLADPRALRPALADGHALRLAEERCRALVQQAASRGRFADWVAMTLREVSGTPPSLEELAAMLNISRRSLNRYLEREGATFRELSARARHELACERLAAGASVTEVAYSLGYSDRSNFGRAFRARTGHSPGRRGKSLQKR
jgi:AraC-like DNA-binding protein